MQIEEAALLCNFGVGCLFKGDFKKMIEVKKDA